MCLPLWPHVSLHLGLLGHLLPPPLHQRESLEPGKLACVRTEEPTYIWVLNGS